MTNGLPRLGLQLSALCAIALAAAVICAFAQNIGDNARQPPGAAARPPVNDPAVWIGRNISAVVQRFGQPTYWNANHEGGGGGNRYFYTRPKQPHFMFETAPGGMIVNAVRLP